jgi:hypothetical protein
MFPNLHIKIHMQRRKHRWGIRRPGPSVVTAVLLYLPSFLAAPSLFAVRWDWTAVPMFHIPSPPFTAGCGAVLLISVTIAVVEALKEYEHYRDTIYSSGVQLRALLFLA